jgi:hypothetical protein
MVITGVPVVQMGDNRIGTFAMGAAASQYVSKVLLAQENIYSNPDLNGNNISNYNNLPWMDYSYLTTFPGALDKIFAADGITPAITTILGVPDSAVAINLLKDPHIFGVRLADMQTAFTTYALYADHTVNSLGGTKLVVIDSPANVFEQNLSNTIYGTNTKFQIKDSAENIHAHIDALNAHPSQVDSIVFTDPTTTVASSGGLMLDGSNGHSVFEISAALAANPTIAIDTLNGWSGDDVIQYSSLLKVVQNTAPAGTGMAHIDSNGYATFVSNSESLNQQIMDVEGALASSNGLPQAGTVVKWYGSGADANNSFVLITGNHATAGDTSHDQVIKIVGVDASHVQVAAGVVVHHS